ncbi:hypothetical protein Ari01nite_62500 [Paractinoplanes rishiriensis]|uniref:Uncharacterized protein n=1 Tax=Paractinoplanes rishiriensis TaxID=1050105 RepID=A0A919K4G1_9ACTN|nr:hypothetical protein Ari01nite_62500 [Actinoplanes rishiriensis]
MEAQFPLVDERDEGGQVSGVVAGHEVDAGGDGHGGGYQRSAGAQDRGVDRCRGAVQQDVDRLVEFAAVPDDLCRAQFAGGVAAAGAGGGDDVGAGVAGELEGEAADRADAGDQDALAGCDGGVFVDGLPGGEPGDRQGCGVRERDGRRCRDKSIFKGDGVRGGGSPVEQADHRPAVDGAGDVVAEGVRQVDVEQVAQQAAPQAQFGRVERRGFHVHQHLAGAGRGGGDVVVGEHRDVSVAVHAHRLHGFDRTAPRRDDECVRTAFVYAVVSWMCSAMC